MSLSVDKIYNYSFIVSVLYNLFFHVLKKYFSIAEPDLESMSTFENLPVEGNASE